MAYGIYWNMAWHPSPSLWKPSGLHVWAVENQERESIWCCIALAMRLPFWSPPPWGFPAFAGMGVSAMPWCPLNNCFFFFIFLQWFLKRVGLHEEFALDFTAWVRGRLSCLGQGTIVTLAKPFSISSWRLRPVALTLLILAPPKVWAPASEEEILNIFVSWHKEAFHPKGSEHR